METPLSTTDDAVKVVAWHVALVLLGLHIAIGLAFLWGPLVGVLVLVLVLVCVWLLKLPCPIAYTRSTYVAKLGLGLLWLLALETTSQLPAVLESWRPVWEALGRSPPWISTFMLETSPFANYLMALALGLWLLWPKTATAIRAGWAIPLWVLLLVVVSGALAMYLPLLTLVV